VRVNRATRERVSAFYRGVWGSLGVYGHLRNLTTNQKVAGSSPAERALSKRFSRPAPSEYDNAPTMWPVPVPIATARYSDVDDGR
jgi:hypothetical protein